MKLPTLEIGTDGNVSTLYADDLDLQEIGRIHNVRRASHITFNEDAQTFTVTEATTGRAVYENPSRSNCIAWEIENFGPGGMYYHG